MGVLLIMFLIVMLDWQIYIGKEALAWSASRKNMYGFIIAEESNKTYCYICIKTFYTLHTRH